MLLFPNVYSPRSAQQQIIQKKTLNISITTNDKANDIPITVHFTIISRKVVIKRISNTTTWMCIFVLNQHYFFTVLSVLLNVHI